MTMKEAAAILDVLPNTVSAMCREGLIRANLVLDKGFWRYELNGRDVQRLDDMREKHGVATGMRLARAKKPVRV